MFSHVKKTTSVAERIKKNIGTMVGGEQFLNSRDLHFSNEELPDLINFLTKQPKIVSGDFCFGFRSYQLMSALISLNTFKRLDFFNPTCNFSNAKDKSLLIDSIEKTTKLEHITFPSLVNDALFSLTKAVKNNQSLNSVGFYLTATEESQHEGAQAIAKDVIEDNPRIKILSLHADILLKETILEIIKAIKSNTTLEELRLFDVNQLNDEIVLALVNATNQRGKPIKLALYYDVHISATIEKIFLTSKNITFLEGHEHIMSDAMRTCFNENKARHAQQKITERTLNRVSLFNTQQTELPTNTSEIDTFSEYKP